MFRGPNLIRAPVPDQAGGVCPHPAPVSLSAPTTGSTESRELCLEGVAVPALKTPLRTAGLRLSSDFPSARQQGLASPTHPTSRTLPAPNVKVFI